MSDSISVSGVSSALSGLEAAGSSSQMAASLAVLQSALQMQADLMQEVLAMLGVGQNVNTSA